MMFSSLEDAGRAYDALAGEVETMLGVQAGLTMVLTALIAKHHDYDQMQLVLTSVVERADQGAWKALTVKQRDVARSVAESLQQIQRVRTEIRPLG